MKGRCCIFLCLLTAAVALFPQYKPWYNHYNFVYGTKAMSMGNAFTAVADDLTAVFWNPAGLAAMRSPEFYFAYQSEHQALEYEPQEKVVSGHAARYDFNFSSTLQQINFFSVSVPAEFWKIKWAFALSYYRYIPYGFKGSAEGALSFQSGNPMAETRAVIFTGSEGADVLAFTTAAGFAKYFALGCTVQQFFGSGTLHLHTPNQAGEIHGQYNESLRGRNFIFGLMFRPFEALSLGFTYHTGVATDFDSSLQVWEVDAQGAEIRQKLLSTRAHVNIPAQYSLGAALRPAKWLGLSCDYSRIEWQKATLEDFYIPGSFMPYPQKDDFDTEQQQVSNLRLGTEINLPLRWFLLHLRGGWSSDGQLYADRNGKQVRIFGYAAGVAVEFSHFLLLEVAYQRQKGDWPEDGYFVKSDTVSSHYSDNLWKFSLTYRFGRIFQE